MSFTKSLMGFVCAVALVAMSSTAYAKTVYVSANAGSNGNGSSGAPFRTISQAVKSKLEPGDVVLVKSGVYSETINIPKEASGLAGRHVVFKSEVEKGAKIDAKSYGFFIAANYITIEGFDIYGAERSGISANGVHNILIKNNTSRNNGTGGIYFSESDFLTIDGNITSGNAANGVTSGISIHKPQNVTGDNSTKGFRIILRNNTSFDNLTKTAGNTDGNGIIFDDFLLRNNYPKKTLKPYSFPGLIENNLVYRNGGSGIRVYASNNITVRNNTAYHNNSDPKRKDSTWRGELQNTSASNNVWVNNIAVANLNHSKNAAGISDVYHKDWGANKNVVWSNNITFNGKRGDKSLGVGTGAISATANQLGVDPMFVGAPSNFRLKAGSPGIDAGTTKYGTGSSALDGSRRVINTIDIGAYEAGGNGSGGSTTGSKPVEGTTEKPSKPNEPAKPSTTKACKVTANTKAAAVQKFTKTCGKKPLDCDPLKNGKFVCSSKKMN